MIRFLNHTRTFELLSHQLFSKFPPKTCLTRSQPPKDEDIERRRGRRKK